MNEINRRGDRGRGVFVTAELRMDTGVEVHLTSQLLALN